MVWGVVGLKAAGMDTGPMSVDRVVREQVGSRSSERWDSALVPIFRHVGEGSEDPHDMLGVGGRRFGL